MRGQEVVQGAEGGVSAFFAISLHEPHGCSCDIGSQPVQGHRKRALHTRRARELDGLADGPVSGPLRYSRIIIPP